MYIIFSSVTRRELLVLLVNANFLTYPLAPILSLWLRTRSSLCPPSMLPSVPAVLISVQTYCYFYRHNKTLSWFLEVPLHFSPSLYNKTHWKSCPYFLTPISSPTKQAVAHSCEPTAVRLVLLSPHWNVSYQGIPWLPCCRKQRSTLIPHFPWSIGSIWHFWSFSPPWKIPHFDSRTLYFVNFPPTSLGAHSHSPLLIPPPLLPNLSVLEFPRAQSLDLLYLLSKFTFFMIFTQFHGINYHLHTGDFQIDNSSPDVSPEL